MLVLASWFTLHWKHVYSNAVRIEGKLYSARTTMSQSPSLVGLLSLTSAQCTLILLRIEHTTSDSNNKRRWRDTSHSASAIALCVRLSAAISALYRCDDSADVADDDDHRTEKHKQRETQQTGPQQNRIGICTVHELRLVELYKKNCSSVCCGIRTELVIIRSGPRSFNEEISESRRSFGRNIYANDCCAYAKQMNWNRF